MNSRHTSFTSVFNLILVVALLLSSFPAPLWSRTAHADTAEQPTRAVSTTTQPDALANPLSVARTQSSHVSNSETVISYHVINNLPTTLLPDIPASATVTDTISLLAGFVLTDDMNTLRDVTLSTTVVAGAISDAGSGAQSGSTVDWALGDVPPGQTVVVTMTVQTPASAADFIDLDSGATVSAEQFGTLISATAKPANIIPDSVDPAYMTGTVDADPNDTDMLWVSAEFEQDPSAAFDYVQSFAYDAYEGSLRGTRGTIWGAAGNSIDQASALIAILRGAGIPARYRHGTLSVADAQTLLGSMFPDSAFEGVAGYVPVGTPTSDPLNDADLLAIAQDHWWVEAYLPGSGWTDMDPSFADAVIGDSFEQSLTGDDRSAELPTSLRHHVAITLRTESYNAFPVAGNNLVTSRPISVTFPAAQVAAKEITLGHIVESDSQGGLVFSTIEHVYSPYFVVDDYELFAIDQSYQDLLTGFPLATQFTVGQFLEFELTDSGGNTQAFERVIKDLLGADVRAGGGNPTLSPPEDNAPLVSEIDRFTTWVLPNTVSPWVQQRRNAVYLSRLQEVAALFDGLNVDFNNLTPEERAQNQEITSKSQVILSSLQAARGIEFAVEADRRMAEREQALLVSQYFATPRIFTLGSLGDPINDVQIETVDLRKTDAETIAYPGQAVSAEFTANWVKGLTESRLEGETLDTDDATALSTYRVFDAMAQQGIEPVLLDADDLGVLNSFGLSPAQYVYAAQSLLDGKQIVIPSQPVTYDGEPTLAWWQFDPSTGDTIGIGESGLYVAAVEYGTELEAIVEELSKPLAEKYQEAVEFLWGIISDGVSGATNRAVSANNWHYLSESACPVEACGIEQFFTDIAPAPVELPEMVFNYVTPTNGAEAAQAAVTVGAGGPFAVATTPPSSAVDVGDSAAFSVAIDNPAAVTFLVNAYTPDGWRVALDGSGAVLVDHPVGVAPGAYDILIVAQSESDRLTAGSVVHTVTVNAGDDLDVVVSAEPNLTIDVNGAQLPDAAFTVDLHNTSSNPHTFDINITGIAEPELILNGIAADATQQITLQPGELRQVGLYYNPPALPAPGTPVTPDAGVTMDSPPLTGSDSGSSSVPTLPYPQLAVPEIIYAPSSGSAEFDLTLTNVGNASGSFALSSDAPTGWSVTNLTSPVNVTDGASDTQIVELITSGGVTGVRYPLFFAADAITAQSTVVIVSADTEKLFGAVDEVVACSADSTLVTYFDAVANSVSLLEGACNNGSCNSAQRDGAVAAVNALVSRLNNNMPAVDTNAASDAAAVLAVADTVQENLDALPPLATGVSDLAQPVCAVAASQPALAWTPVFDAVQSGDTVTYTLDLTNHGALTSTYALTVELPTGPFTAAPTLDPAATASYDFPITAATAQLIELPAAVTATNSPLSAADATAFANVVERFIQLAQVLPTPNFVETGVSQSTVNATIANFANVPLEATAVATLLSPDGSVVDSAETDLIIRPGNPQVYELNTFNTSAFDSGVYTVTVDVVDSADNPIDDGSNYAFLGVGQALGAEHAVQPELVAPGTVTVTTVISTEILVETAVPTTPAEASPLWRPTGLRVSNDQLPIVNDHLPTGEAPDDESLTIDHSPLTIDHSIQALSHFTRTEDNDAAIVYTGFGNRGIIGATENRVQRSNTPGATAVYTFTGPWVNVGLLGNNDGGFAEIAIDGTPVAVVDTYRNQTRPIDFIFDGLTNATHTLTVTVQGTSNPLAGNTYVHLDFIDVWDGTPLAQGSFEEDTDPFFYTPSFSNRVDPDASDGHYRRGEDATGWFVFSGTGVDLDVFKYNDGGVADFYLDGEFQARIDLYSFDDITETITFDGLADTLHVLTVRSLSGTATVDKAVVPASGTPYTSPACTGYCRFEATDLALQYNGLPVTATASTWDQQAYSRASGDAVYRSNSANDTATLAFTGEWVKLGLIGDRNTGDAAVYIDGVLVDIVDTYRNADGRLFAGTPIELAYPLTSGAHTISVTVLGTSHPNSSGTYVAIDHVDTWDGTPLGNGSFEEDDARIFYSNGFSTTSDGDASGGTYRQDSAVQQGTVWFPFEGDSVMWEGMVQTAGSRQSQVFVDGVFVGELNQIGGDTVQRDFAFDGFGPGMHILRLDRNRGELIIDGFAVPGSAPFYSTPVITGFVRYEEDHPDLSYNGDTWWQRPTTWSETAAIPAASNGYAVSSSTANNTIALTFTGSWLNFGWYQRNTGGSAEIYIDNVLVDTVSLNTTLGSSDWVITSTQLSVLTGTHDLEIRVVGDGTVWLDYIDVYEGVPVSDAYIDADVTDGGGQVNLNRSVYTYDNPNATDSDYLGVGLSNATGTVWYTFNGDNAAVRYFTRGNTSRFDVYIDGAFVETVDAQYPFTEQPFNRFYTDLGDGPHVLRIENDSAMRIDGFESNIDNPVQIVPTVEWYDDAPGGLTGAFSTPAGMLMGLAVGDINNDGIIEIVAPSDAFTADGSAFQNAVFIYRGDGQDAGGGSPLINRIDFTPSSGPPSRETIGSVALADLDMDGDSEIIVPSDEGMYAFHHDGTPHWFDDTFQAYVLYGTPAVGNLDADPEPEIVVNMDRTLVVYEADGTIGWTKTLTAVVGMPLLADVNGDTVLDIVFTNGDALLNTSTMTDTLFAYDYNFGAPTLIWSAPITSTIDDIRGGPAVGDIDGDGLPEIAVASNGWVSVFNGDDGSVLWETELDPGTPGGVSIADVDGDDEVEIVTGMKYDDGTGIGRLYALNANGSILWERPAYDDTSANTASVLDVNGDGVYEIAWNGAQTGFTIFNGADGAILFNEPDLGVLSLTGTEYPVFADVDLDGYAEVVVPANKGLRVFGLDGAWGEARPLWNQHSYHITNINDDLSVPFNEYDSWTAHNTYRTQFPSTIALPRFTVNISHTVGAISQTVDAGSFNVPPTVSVDPLYGWDYVQTGVTPAVTRTFDSVLTDLVPGETRLVASGTVVSYTLGSGQNTVVLPPLFVSAARLITLNPATQTVGAGASSMLTATLTNPGASPATYTLSWTAFGVSGMQGGIAVPANGSAEIPITLSIPQDASGATTVFVQVDNGSGGSDSAGATLTVVNALDVTLTPSLQNAPPGATRSYTATITNNLDALQTVALTADGLPDVTLPPNVIVDANSSATVAVVAKGYVAGQLPFSVAATNENGASDSADGVLVVTGSQDVSVTLNPEPAVAGPGLSAYVTVTVRNEGDAVTTFDLAVNAPAGWTTDLGETSVTLPPEVFNSAEIPLILTPPPGTPAASYAYTVTATAQDGTFSPALPAAATVVGTVDVGARAVQVDIDPTTRILLPNDSAVWNVTVTNSGSVADTYVLTTTGVVALSGQFSQSSVTLNPGQSTVMQLSADAFEFVLPGSYTFAVAALSQGDSAIVGEARAQITVVEQEAVLVEFSPNTVTVPVNEVASYFLTITNTGNLPTVYDLAVGTVSGASASVTAKVDSVTIPALTTATVLVTASADTIGTRSLQGSATSTAGTNDAQQAELVVEAPTAVTLAALGAVLQSDGSVRVQWTTATEIDNAGFNVYRSATPTLDMLSATRLNPVLITAQAEFGQGATYQLLDTEIAAGVWYYFLEDVDLSGAATTHGPVSVETGVPTSVGVRGLDGAPLAIALPILLIVAALFLLLLFGHRVRMRR